MILVKIEDRLMVLDSLRREVLLSIPLESCCDIYNAFWVTQKDDVVVEDYVALTEEARSFKELKHYVTRYIIDHKIPTNKIPQRYIDAYLRNK